MPEAKGFTLVELMVTMVVAMVILGGLMTSFIQQNGEYKYQNKRIDAVQDLEFVIKFIAEDLRGAVILVPLSPPDPVLTPVANGTANTDFTTGLTFDTWENDVAFWTNAAEQLANKYRAARRFEYDSANESLSYDRNTIPATNMTEILPNVTFFKVFNDSDDSREVSGGLLYAGIPGALPSATLKDPNGTNVVVPGYTILIEVKVDAGYKYGSFSDVLGGDHDLYLGGDGFKRIWRYIQVYPKAAVN